MEHLPVLHAVGRPTHTPGLSRKSFKEYPYGFHMERTVKEVHGSLLVTIPRDLARRLDIGKGTKMKVDEDNGRLVLTKDETRVLWTIGYERDTPESLARALKERGVQQVVDVRELPLSRRKGFSKTPLSEHLASHGLSYIHQRELGAPKEVRKPFLENRDFSAFREGYLAHLEGQEEGLDRLVQEASRKRTAILCVEQVHSMCHRQFIAAALSERGFEIRHA